MMRFRDEVLAAHDTDHVNLVFNNAGIGGGGSFLTASREEWERTFGVCWGGVYNGSRAFLPLLVASHKGYLGNTSRTEERRVGNELVSQCRCRCGQDH